jgi:heat-inducible transcriptional repressor
MTRPRHTDEPTMSRPPEDFLSQLNTRSQDIFKRLVERYLETGTPVGSRDLSKLLSVGLSPASVRNVMADLEDLGLIAAPHTSAGRLPTQQGLRFFVDAMLEVGSVDERERKAIDPDPGAGGTGQGRGPADRGEPAALRAEPWGRRRHRAEVGPGAQAYRVRAARRADRHGGAGGRGRHCGKPHRAAAAGAHAESLTQASNYLANFAVGRTLAEARQVLKQQREAQLAELDELTRKLVEAGRATISESGGSTPTVIVRGRANLINDTMASEELERIRRLFDELESRNGLIELLGDTETAEGVKIFIGSENKLFGLSGSSVILSPYKDANEKVVGVLGVIGPTRLNYARIVPVVDYTANVISRMLAHRK